MIQDLENFVQSKEGILLAARDTYKITETGEFKWKRNNSANK